MALVAKFANKNTVTEVYRFNDTAYTGACIYSNGSGSFYLPCYMVDFKTFPEEVQTALTAHPYALYKIGIQQGNLPPMTCPLTLVTANDKSSIKGFFYTQQNLTTAPTVLVADGSNIASATKCKILFVQMEYIGDTTALGA